MSKLTAAHFKRKLALIAGNCHFTADDGGWDFGPDGKRDWDAIDNSTKGIGFLTADTSKRVYLKAKAKAETAAA